MDGTPRLYETLVQVCSPHHNGLDRRQLKPLAWMMAGLIQAGNISLTAWVPSRHSRAVYAQRTVRRLTRWLEQTRRDVHALYGPLMQRALAEWGDQRVYLALDTSMWWQTDGLVRIALVSRGRAIPMVWTVLEHPSSRVAYDVYKALVETVVEWRPVGCTVVLTAERGGADTPLMTQLTGLGWHGRLRVKGSCGIDRQGKRRGNVNRMPLSPGKALCWHHVDLTTQGYGPVHLALGRPISRQEDWFVVSDEPTDEKTFEAYGRRCDLAEHGLDDQATGFQRESSLLRSAHARHRLGCVLAITTLALVAQGTAVVAQGTRRWVDAHGCRGQSDLNIGWQGGNLALSRGDALLPHVQLSAEADPAPAMASQLQHQKPPQLFLALAFEAAVA